MIANKQQGECMPQYYGVWIGREPGIYDNWDDCRV